MTINYTTMQEETKKQRTARILRTLMFELGIDSVSKFCNEINANYMQVYYTYNGQVNSISYELISKILNKYPRVNRKYLESGEGDVFVNSDNSKLTERTAIDKPVSLDDMFRLLDRLTTLFEKVQKREEHIEQLQERTEKLLEQIINHEGVSAKANVPFKL